MTSLIRKFLELSFPLKFAIGSIFGIIAGPGLLAFLSEYATYLYAVRLNLRPPLEGIPYLSASVALASLVLSISAIFIFLTSRWIITKSINFLIVKVEDFEVIVRGVQGAEHEPFKLADKSIKYLQNLKLKKAMLAIVLVALSFTTFVYLFSNFVSFFSESDGLKRSELPPIFIYLIIVLLSLWKPIVNWLIAFAFATLFYFFSFQLLFDMDHYSQYLRIIKYGGNIPITLTYKNTRDTEHANLLLRTRDYLFIQQPNQEMIKEVPLPNILAITYK